VGAVNVLVDISDRKRAEQALQEIRDAERSRIARDLHDTVLQDLSATLQSLQAAQLELRDLNLGQEVETLRRAVRGLRNAVYDLRMENKQSLSLAVKSLVELNRQRAPECEMGVTVSRGFPLEVPEAVSSELVRIVQEALTNACQHSGARRIEVSMEADEGEIRAQVSDNGRGFEPHRTRPGVGLTAMKERAALIDGDLEIRSKLRGGTQVRFRVRRTS
jgi:signal transduction histidine kinase